MFWIKRQQYSYHKHRVRTARSICPCRYEAVYVFVCRTMLLTIAGRTFSSRLVGSLPQTRPATTKHKQTRPATTKHEQTRPATTKHKQTRPATTKHKQTRPATTKHEQTRPATTKHEQTRPATTKHKPLLPFKILLNSFGYFHNTKSTLAQLAQLDNF